MRGNSLLHHLLCCVFVLPLFSELSSFSVPGSWRWFRNFRNEVYHRPQRRAPPQRAPDQASRQVSVHNSAIPSCIIPLEVLPTRSSDQMAQLRDVSSLSLSQGDIELLYRHGFRRLSDIENIQPLDLVSETGIG